MRPLPRGIPVCVRVNGKAHDFLNRSGLEESDTGVAWDEVVDVIAKNPFSAVSYSPGIRTGHLAVSRISPSQARTAAR